MFYNPKFSYVDYRSIQTTYISVHLNTAFGTAHQPWSLGPPVEVLDSQKKIEKGTDQLSWVPFFYFLPKKKESIDYTTCVRASLASRAAQRGTNTAMFLPS